MNISKRINMIHNLLNDIILYNKSLQSIELCQYEYIDQLLKIQKLQRLD